MNSSSDSEEEEMTKASLGLRAHSAGLVCVGAGKGGEGAWVRGTARVGGGWAHDEAGGAFRFFDSTWSRFAATGVYSSSTGPSSESSTSSTLRRDWKGVCGVAPSPGFLTQKKHELSLTRTFTY